MKNHIDSYGLYNTGKLIKHTVRVRVTLKDDVDIDILKATINRSIHRYPYFKVKPIIDKGGGYNLEKNDKDIVVIKTCDDLPKLGSNEVNNHLFYVDAKGKDINFNISHSLAGGKGITPLIETSLYEYITNKYHVSIDAPNIRKVDSNLLSGEDMNFDVDIFKRDDHIKLNHKKSYTLVKEYLDAIIKPNKNKSIYYILSFESKDILKYTKNNDSSIASAFVVFVFKALCKVLPQKAKIISAGIAHNPLSEYGYPNNHSDLLSHINVVFKREMQNWDNERLGTVARSQIYLQTDKDYTSTELTNKLISFNNLDKRKTKLTKRLYAFFKCSFLSNAGGSSSYHINYTGKRDWGELANYIESYVFIVDGHVMSEITSMNDKLFMCFLQLNENPKYIEAIEEILGELKIPFEIKGPFKTNNVKVELPR